MSEVDKNVAAGADSEAETIGITGLAPLRVIRCPEMTLRLAPGILRIQIHFVAGDELQPGKSLVYRVFGGEAGLQLNSTGRLVRVGDPRLPLHMRYEPRGFPVPPPRGQLLVDLGFWHRDGSGWGAEDVQWRQPVLWDKRGGATQIELELTATAP